MNSRLVLGTVQFGLDYGISNKRGLIPKEEVFKILRTAFDSGIDTLDTAQAYGESETVIGEFIKTQRTPFKIITKLRDTKPEEIRDGIMRSIQRTSASSLYALLMHSFEEHQAEPKLYDQILQAKLEGLVMKTGFSLYRPDEAQQLLDDNAPFDIVQVPYNIFDRRFDSILASLHAKGVEIHARSAFLQGLLLMSPEELSEKFSKIKPKIKLLREQARHLNVPLPVLCLAFVFTNKNIAKVVIGVDGIESFIENTKNHQAIADLAKHPKLLSRLDVLGEDDEDILLPQNWARQNGGKV